MTKPYDTSRTQIPMPSVLADTRGGDTGNRDPERSGDAGPIHHEVSVPTAGDADHAVSDYARTLWITLDEVARYLRDDLAHGGGTQPSADRSSPLRTDEQWESWRATYASVLSVLAGPAGDEGYGEQEAQVEYQNRAT
jgi:hypothetical protein